MNLYIAQTTNIMPMQERLYQATIVRDIVLGESENV